MNKNFFVKLHQQMTQSENRVMLELQERNNITYGDANSLSAKLANKLKKLGLKTGDRITCQVEKSPEVVLLYLACLRSRIIFHPINTAYTLKEVEFFFMDAQPALVVCDPSALDDITLSAKRCDINAVYTLDASGNGTLTNDLSEFSDQHSIVQQQSDDTALLIYTSGTTGKPKAAMITHNNLKSNTESLLSVWGWSTDDVLLHVLPLFHVHGLCVALNCPIMKASKIIFRSVFSVQDTVRLLSQATILMGVPTIYSRLLAAKNLTKASSRKIRLFISGSAPLRPETHREFEQKTGHRILERYGMTEAGMITSNPLDGDRVAGSVGFALPDVELRVRNENGELAKAGHPGVLEISGPNVFNGYWRNETATSEVFSEDGYFITGDIATISEEGVVTIVGRKSDLIISAGFNIYPKEIEIQLNRIPDIADSSVFGVPHPDLGEAVVAALIQDESTTSGEPEILDRLKSELSSFKIPRRFIWMDEFPRNAMGKIEKNKLRERYGDLFGSS